jgi:carboxypeptidase Taq
MTRLLPMLATRFGAPFDELEPAGLYRAANAVGPSLIRVEADEVTYNLHIVLRFELEQEIFDGTLALGDLPEAWNARMSSYFGLDVPTDADGVLQDVHWSSGAFGYFPTYSLGNVIAAQVWELANEALPDLDNQIAAGELEPLRAFLGDRIYRHGGKLEPAEMIERVTGGPLDPGPLLRHLEAKFGELYGLDVTKKEE